VTLSFDDTAKELINSSLAHLTDIVEVDYVQQHYLREPSMTLKEFSVKWRLSPKRLGAVKNRSLANLKRILAEKKILSMADVV
jgi:hypothetical protein